MAELDLIIMKKRDSELRQMKFAAGLKGIDLDAAAKEDEEERIEEVKRRAAIRLLGEHEAEVQEFADFGFNFESD